MQSKMELKYEQDSNDETKLKQSIEL